MNGSYADTTTGQLHFTKQSLAKSYDREEILFLSAFLPFCQSSEACAVQVTLIHQLQLEPLFHRNSSGFPGVDPGYCQ